MRGVPKIVLERLKRKNMADQDHRQSTIENRLFLHPDANLLAAFVEKTLTEKERAQVLSHLAQCAECRELVALILPAEVEAPEPTRLPARQGWSVWRLLGWGGLAAALGAVVIVVVLHSYPRRRQTIAAHPAGAESKQQVSLMAAAPPPVAMETKNARTSSRSREIPKRERATSVGAAPFAPPLAKPAFKPPAAPGGTVNAATSVVSQGGATTVPVNAETGPVSKDLSAAQAVEVLAPSSTLHHPLVPSS